MCLWQMVLFFHGVSVWMPGEPGPRTAGRRGCAVASVLRSKTLVQGESTSPEQIKFPWGGATTGSEIQKGKHRKAVLSFLVEAAGVEPASESA